MFSTMPILVISYKYVLCSTEYIGSFQELESNFLYMPVKLTVIVVAQEEIEASVPSEAEYRDCEWVIRQSPYVRPKRVCK